MDGVVPFLAESTDVSNGHGRGNGGKKTTTRLRRLVKRVSTTLGLSSPAVHATDHQPYPSPRSSHGRSPASPSAATTTGGAAPAAAAAAGDEEAVAGLLTVTKLAVQGLALAASKGLGGRKVHIVPQPPPSWHPWWLKNPTLTDAVCTICRWRRARPTSRCPWPSTLPPTVLPTARVMTMMTMTTTPTATAATGGGARRCRSGSPPSWPSQRPATSCCGPR